METHEPKRTFRIEEFAHRNSISRAQVYIEIREGRLEARKLGSATLIPIEAESRWLNALPVKKSAPTAA